MDNETARVGVIGCGWAGTERHLPSYAACDRASITAVYDHNPGKARKAAATYEEATPHDSLESMLGASLDIVSITTPPWTHADISCKALRADCDVLSEKPMAMSRTEAKQMLNTAESTGNHLGIVHNFLFTDSVQRVRSLVASGKLGNIRTVHGFQTSSSNRHLPEWHSKLPGGLVFDEIPHFLYLLEEFAGPLDFVDAHGVESDGQIDTLTGTLQGDKERLATIDIVFRAPLSEWYLVVVGSEMIAVVDLFRDSLTTFDAETSHSAREVLSVSLSKIRQEMTGIVSSGLKMVRGTLKFGMLDLIEDFVHGSLSGTGPTIDATDGYQTFEHQLSVLERVGVMDKRDDNVD